MHGTLPNARPAWFPDWSADVCALIGAGESATAELVAQLKGRARVLVLNTSFRIAPWADALYACDARWWNAPPDARSFAGLKITQDEAIAKSLRIHHLRLAEHTFPDADTILLDRPGLVGRGGNGGFQALNMLIQWGARRIIAVLDYRGPHWHGKHPQGLVDPRPQTLEKWAKVLDAQAPMLTRIGVEMVDVTSGGALGAYPKMTASDALKMWGCA